MLIMRFDVIGVTHFTTARTLVFENLLQGYESMLISFSHFTCILCETIPRRSAFRC